MQLLPNLLGSWRDGFTLTFDSFNGWNEQESLRPVRE